MRVALYARVSTQRQAQADGVAQQLDRLQAHAASQGWTVVAENIFRDDGYSGASLKRPGLERLRDRAALRHLDRVLITAPDRLARHYVHQVLLLEEITATGCQVEFLDRPMSRDPHDQLLLQIRGAVAEYERSLIAERMRRGRLRKLQAGLLLPWTRPPYGYRVDPDRPRDPAGVRCDEAEAAAVAAELGVETLLFNCSQPEVIGAAIDVARETFERLGVKIQLGAYANAFPPQPKEATANDGLDPLRDDLDPPGYLQWAADWQTRGASHLGGCCGIGPEHIAVLAQKLV